jgi:hypothetical protein
MNFVSPRHINRPPPPNEHQIKEWLGKLLGTQVYRSRWRIKEDPTEKGISVPIGPIFSIEADYISMIVADHHTTLKIKIVGVSVNAGVACSIGHGTVKEIMGKVALSGDVPSLHQQHHPLIFVTHTGQGLTGKNLFAGPAASFTIGSGFYGGTALWFSERFRPRIKAIILSRGRSFSTSPLSAGAQLSMYEATVDPMKQGTVTTHA